MTYSDALWENVSGDIGVTFGSHGTCTTVIHFVLLLRKKRRKKPGMRRTCWQQPSKVRLIGYSKFHFLSADQEINLSTELEKGDVEDTNKISKPQMCHLPVYHVYCK